MFSRILMSGIGVATLAIATAWPVAASAQSTSAAPARAPVATVRIRGTLVYADASSLIVRDRKGDVISLARADKMPISEVYRIKLSDIKPGSYIGTAAMPQTDGSQQALEVLVFPEAARGTGEGHFPWDLQPQSTMTNATVTDVTGAPVRSKGGRQLRLTYKGGEKIVTVPPNVPIVTVKPGDDALLVPGAQVLVNAQMRGGAPTALRVTAGRHGFAPPM